MSVDVLNMSRRESRSKKVLKIDKIKKKFKNALLSRQQATQQKSAFTHQKLKSQNK